MLKQQVYNEWLRVRRKLASLGANIDLDINDFRDDLDLAFANYALNEQPLFLSREEKELARELYGGLEGLKGGLAYRGYRIETEKELKEMKKLVNGGTWDANLDSFSHSKSTARAFADFVKTYDPMIGMMQMERAISQGSAGKYGSYIMTVKPDKDNVIFNTANPDITRSVESELILDGPVKVVSVEIREPLTEDNWVDLTIGKWESLEDMLGSSAFVGTWLEKKNINPWDHGLGRWLSDQVRGKEKLAEFLTDYKKSDNKFTRFDGYYDWLSSHPNVRDLFDDIELEGTHLTTNLNGRSVSLGRELYEELLAIKGGEQALQLVEKHAEELSKSFSKYVVSDRKIDAGDSWGAFYPVSNYLTALIKAKQTGVFKKSMLKILDGFTDFIEELAEQPLTTDNIKDYREIIRNLADAHFDNKAAEYVGYPLRKVMQNLVMETNAKINDRNVNVVFQEDIREFMKLAAEILKNVFRLL